MRGIAVLLACLALAPTAGAAEPGLSGPERVVFPLRNQDVFTGLEIRETFKPVDSTVGIQLDAVADVSATLDGEIVADGTLSWPDAYQQTWADGGDGELKVTVEIDFYVTVTVRISDWFSWNLRVWDYTLPTWQGTVATPATVLPGGVDPAALPEGGESIRLESYSYPVDAVIDVVTISLVGDLRPLFSGTVSGQAIETDRQQATALGQPVALDGPDEDEGGKQARFSSRWRGQVDASLVANLEPTISVSSIWLGTVYDDTLAYPIDLFDVQTEVQSEEVDHAYDLPWIAVQESLDLGRTYPGDLLESTLRVRNDGLLPLAMTASVEGEGFFVDTVEAGAAPGAEAGFDLGFEALADELPGELEGTLVLSTNDPARPEIRLPLYAEIVARPDGPVDDTGAPSDDDTGGPGPGTGAPPPEFTGACSCQSAPGWTMAVGWGLPLVGLLTVRRRRTS